MADLRLAIGLLAACAQAAGAPSPTTAPTPPAGWHALPELAKAVAAAATAPGVVVGASEAWGDPAMGCYATWLALRGSTEGFADQALASLTAGNFAVREVTRPAGALALTFERAPFRGRLRARAEGDQVVALACFANAREPAACDTACTPLIGALP